jgi:cation diffusion facilitator family transporter
VIIASVTIHYKPEYKIIDPICTYMFSLIVLYTTFNVSKEIYQILMEGTPTDIRTDFIREDILKIKGVAGIDDFHCWTLSGGKNMLTAHISLHDVESDDNDDGN